MRFQAIRTCILAIVLSPAVACGDGGDDPPANAAPSLQGADGDGPEAGSGGSGGDASRAGDDGGRGMFPGLAIVPCPEDLTFSLNMEAVGEQGRVKARLVDADPAPPQRYRNDWTLEFLDLDGNPMDDIELTKSQAFMPAHGHDGRYPTEVTKLDEPGQIQVDNLNMFMGGPWEVRLWVNAAGAEDYIVFDVCIPQ